MLPEVLQWRVAPNEAGARLDTWLAGRLGISRAAVRRVLESGGVRVADRAAAAKSRLLVAGECVEVRGFVPPADAAPLSDAGTPLVVVASGAGWLVVDKPPGMPVHPLRSDERGTVTNALVASHPALIGVGEGGLRSGVVHRLDVDTSGALLVATDSATYARLRAAFRAHRVRKTYRALVHGEPPAEGALDLALAVTQHRPARVRVMGPGDAASGDARRARLAFRTCERFDGAALVEVDLATGFLHQVRASLAHIGHPLLGDPAYGAPEATPCGVAATRQMLHAARLAVDEIDVTSFDAVDFASTLARLRASSRRHP